MDVVTLGNTNYVYAGRFTGTVEIEMVFEAIEQGDADIARITSQDGAVTKWHSHPGGQVLLLLSGRGRAGDRQGDHRDLEPGTFLRVVPDEEHWHGAEAGQDATWLGITYGVTQWTDEVPECCR